jgi:SAM-dependent methyltransferase
VTATPGTRVAETPWFVPLLACPACLDAKLAERPGALACRACGHVLSWRGRQLAAFPPAGAVGRWEFPLRQAPALWPTYVPPPDGGYHGPLTERTNARHLAVLAARRPPLAVLDWGCGTAEYRAPVERLGHRYLGVDAAGEAADVLVDLHRLPFVADGFDHVITNAVLEHVANPFVAVAEAARVLKPGGIFSGSAAFLEPYHHASRFHLSPDAIVEVFALAGLELEALWPQEHWSVFDSLATMPGPVSSPARWLLRAAGRLNGVLRGRFWHPRERRHGRWLRPKTGAERRDELLIMTGQIDFVARKPAPAAP